MSTSDLPLFAHPMARRSDHDSSHVAADRMEASGAAKRQRDEALGVVKRWPGLSASKLARLAKPPGGCADCYRNMLSRRLSELRRDGLVEALKPTGREIQWFPK